MPRVDVRTSGLALYRRPARGARTVHSPMLGVVVVAVAVAVGGWGRLAVRGSPDPSPCPRRGGGGKLAKVVYRQGKEAKIWRVITAMVGERYGSPCALDRASQAASLMAPPPVFSPHLPPLLPPPPPPSSFSLASGARRRQRRFCPGLPEPWPGQLSSVCLPSVLGPPPPLLSLLPPVSALQYGSEEVELHSHSYGDEL